MQTKIRLGIILMLLIPFFGTSQQKISIIPKPVSLIAESGHFTIDKNTSIIFNPKETDLHHAANFFNAFIKNVSGIVLPVNV